MPPKRVRNSAPAPYPSEVVRARDRLNTSPNFAGYRKYPTKRGKGDDGNVPPAEGQKHPKPEPGLRVPRQHAVFGPKPKAQSREGEITREVRGRDNEVLQDGLHVPNPFRTLHREQTLKRRFVALYFGCSFPETLWVSPRLDRIG